MASSPVDGRLNNFDQRTLQSPVEQQGFAPPMPEDQSHRQTMGTSQLQYRSTSQPDHSTRAIQSIVADIQTFASRNSAEVQSNPAPIQQPYRCVQTGAGMYSVKN